MTIFLWGFAMVELTLILGAIGVITFDLLRTRKLRKEGNYMV